MDEYRAMYTAEDILCIAIVNASLLSHMIIVAIFKDCSEMSLFYLSGCQSCWTPFESNCYRLFLEKYSFDDCRARCQNGIPAIINDEKTKNFATATWGE